MLTTLVDAAALASHLDDPRWAIVDCRSDLLRPEWGAQAYAEGHIPGALFARLEHDLSSEITAQTGRHPLPTREHFAQTLDRWGIDADTQVVAYDQGNSAYAARLWWMMRWAGHEAVAVLDGGYAAWQTGGFPVSREPASREPTRFPLRDGATVVTTAELQNLLARDAALLVDARAADRFGGRNETIDPVAGHVPGAINHPFAGNLDERNRFRTPAQLREQWTRTLGKRLPHELVAMCGSGVTACHDLLALEIAGLPGGRLYAGSWSEWIRDPSRPVANDHT